MMRDPSKGVSLKFDTNVNQIKNPLENRPLNMQFLSQLLSWTILQQYEIPTVDARFLLWFPIYNTLKTPKFSQGLRPGPR